MAENVDDRKQHPRSIQALLKFCLESTKSEDVAGTEGVTEMDPEVGKQECVYYSYIHMFPIIQNIKHALWAL
jgi:hypothetical protein